MGPAQRDSKNFSYVRPTHEEEAAFMATAHAKFTGEVGVCISTSGPGALHLLNGLYDAQGDNAPVVAIVGQQGRVSLGSEFQQEINLERVFSDVAVFVQTVTTPMHTQLVVDKAIRMAKAYRGPAVVVLPADIQNLEMEEPAVEHFVSRSGVGYVEDRLVPDDSALAKAAEVLNSGEKVAMLVGQGAIGATDEVLEVAERLGAGVSTALLGKQVVPGDIAYHTQQLGLLGSRPSYDMMQTCDTLLLVGTNFPYGEFLPPTGQARAVQIDLSPRHLGIRYPTEVNLWGDAKTTLSALLPHLQQHDTAWQDSIAEQMRDWDAENDRVAQTKADPINPRRVFTTLNDKLPQNAIITADAG
ncbi:MAG: thiamine pyrophosphate-requiring protein, partial [Micrococcus sp.]|nr:thiamine pyrophosphate-requiring protein [Micrococcus sp.]